MRVTLPDDVLDAYQVYATRQGVPLESVVATQLRRFRALEPGRKAVVIGAHLEEALAERLGNLPLKDGEDLLERLRNYAGITFADIRIGLSAAQAAELQHRAERQGRPVEDLVREMVARVTADLFWGTGGGPAADSAPQHYEPATV